MSNDLVKRLRDPAFGTETTERNLMNNAANRIEQLAAINEELEAKLAEVSEALVSASQILSQCTWATMLVNNQYVDRKEAVRGYRATLASLQGDKT
jgi:hypothetical protein